MLHRWSTRHWEGLQIDESSLDIDRPIEKKKHGSRSCQAAIALRKEIRDEISYLSFCVDVIDRLP